MKTYEWQVVRQSGGTGLRVIAGTFQARDVKHLREQIGEELASYASGGLIRGDYVLLMTDKTHGRPIAERTIYVHSNHPHPMPNDAADEPRPLVDVLGRGASA